MMPAIRCLSWMFVPIVLLSLPGCEGGGTKSTLVTPPANPAATLAVPPPNPNRPFLTAPDVTAIVQRAAQSLGANTMVIAVTDREGIPLGVYHKGPPGFMVTGNFGATVDANDYALGLARTGAFFSNDRAPLSSRTVRFISSIHFPPGIENKANGALYGIENTNRGCSLACSPGVACPPGLTVMFNAGHAITPARSFAAALDPAVSRCDFADQSGCGVGIVTGKPDRVDSSGESVNGGGVPIFKSGVVVGGIGVTGVDPASAEFAAFVGSIPDARFGPQPAPPGAVILDGIQLPFVEQIGPPPGTTGGIFDPALFVLGPVASPLSGPGVPDGFLVGPSPSVDLSVDELMIIVAQAVEQANVTRAAIRLPLGSATRMVIAVSDLEGNLLALYRMPDATVFSIDVAATKARNIVYFSSSARAPGDLPGVPPGTAVTNRTISFGAQPLYPPGIDGTGPGPFFDLFVGDVATECRQGAQPPNVNQSGIVFFPGSVPLYKNGQPVGGIGVSGDGVEQDDLVSAAGATGFAPPLEIRADNIVIGDARLPFLKFPRNPEL